MPWPSEDNSAALKYLGQTLGTFLVFEYSGELLIIDQHAAHERIIFDQLESRRVVCQDLMVPYVYEAASDEEDRQLEGLQPALALQGFRLTKEGGSWILHSLPAILPVEHGGVLFEVVRQGQDTAAIMHQLRANIACKAAIKDGTSLPDDAALSLGRQALALPEARCPHGRPIWLRISRQQLFEAVGRLV
ncbi:MAG: hypothetical protein A2004_08675 [Spirochaetes bacterium GWC1_61_12]|nr:MAG: hypothetical protein A2004_08675 [Spirochaetes bacterium GWC1_61_12]